MSEGREVLDPTVTLVPKQPQPERRIGAYRLLRELGHGGMGTVFLAVRADEQFEKRVAIKVVRGPDNEEVIRFFRRERQILAGLEHPNIARLLDGGTTDDGLPYFVMEHVEGEPIDAYCDERKLPVRERLRLFQGVCAAVQYAHRSLVVHRDLKPANILVTAEGVPKLLDFGIAKLLNPGVSGTSAETMVAMTPDYASPEQVRGRSITTATDVYSLGVVLYELLAGRRPYRTQGDSMEMLKAVCDEEPERPSTAAGRTEQRRRPDGTTSTTSPEDVSRLREGSPERLQRRLRGDLDAIVLGALQKEPTERYRSVEAFSEDIRHYLEGLPVRARKASGLYRLRKLASRHKLGVAAAAAIALLLLALGGTMTVQSARIRKERDRATVEAAKASAINAFLQDALGAADPWAKGSKNVSLLDALHQAQTKAETAFHGQPLVEAAMLQTIGVTFTNLADYNEADRALRRSLDLRVAATGPQSAETAKSLGALSKLYREWRKYDEAVNYARETVAITNALYGAKSLEAASAMNWLATALRAKGQLPEAKSLAEEMLRLAHARRGVTGGVDPQEVELEGLALLVGIALDQEDFKTMESVGRERLALLKARYGDRHPDVASALDDFATAQMLLGDLVAAERTYNEALALETALLGPDHPDVASLRENLGNVYFRSGKLDETARNLEVVLAMRRKALGDDSEPVARTLANMGAVYLSAGNLPAAEQKYREALPRLVRVLGPEHLDVANVLSGLGSTLRKQGKFEEADADMRRALAIRVKALGETHASTQKLLKSLAELNAAWGKPVDAAAYQARLVAKP